MAENPAFLVMRWNALTIGNRLRDQIKTRKIDLIVMSFGAAMIGAYLSDVVYRPVMHNAAALRAAWPILSMIGLGASVLLGVAVGLVGVSLMLNFAFSRLDRYFAHYGHDAAGLAAFVLGAAEAGLLGIGVSIIYALIGIEHPGIAGLVVATAFLLSFAAALIAHLWFICQPRFPTRFRATLR